MVLAFVMMTADALVLNIFQALVRVARPHYTSGQPPFVVVFAMFIGLILACTLMLGLLSVASERRPSGSRQPSK